ncbi:lysophospholipid acyltransferase family protein [Endomicrobium proavitum]|uniref:Putative Lipid A biosynthesis acyltransferase n=1 Tax=Endomicrobium proavitum TaxID=1408281 RepID=A0A0G3WHW4_9BACT|nr:lysophospholipid acyltransferase family protein [Endomicrobium proavitum]AKL97460.1 putative Lipid A biosynthesis acyltransferase [Endomicrobium proavitum]
MSAIKKIRRKIYYYVAFVVSKVVLAIPYKFSVGVLGPFFGAIGYCAARSSTAIAKKNLRECFPKKSEKEISKIAKAVFINQGKNFFELANFPKLNKERLEKIASVENADLIKKSLDKGKGILFVSAHVGNWEIIAAMTAGFGVPVNVVAKRIYIEGLNNMLVGYRTSKNVKVILKDSPDTARKLIKALKGGEIIAMLIDQDTNVPGVFVDFFGKPAWTPSGLAVLALKTGAQVLVGLDCRVGKYAHKGIISGPVLIEPSGNFNNDVAALTQKATNVLENYIKKYPEQWVWFHERWKTKQT